MADSQDENFWSQSSSAPVRSLRRVTGAAFHGLRGEAAEGAEVQPRRLRPNGHPAGRVQDRLSLLWVEGVCFHDRTATIPETGGRSIPHPLLYFQGADFLIAFCFRGTKGVPKAFFLLQTAIVGGVDTSHQVFVHCPAIINPSNTLPHVMGEPYGGVHGGGGSDDCSALT